MKKFAAIVLSVGVLLGTAGCATAEMRTDNAERNTSEIVYEHSDGRKVPCLFYVSGSAAAMSCDWANAK